MSIAVIPSVHSEMNDHVVSLEERLTAGEIDLLRSKTLLFLHIHKTAGTTLNRIIESQYNPFRIYTIEGRMIEWSLRHFKALSARRRARFRVVKGHMSFGLHSSLPQPSTYITFLRHPVERAISAYYYAKGNPLNPLHKRIVRENIDLLTYLKLAPWNNDLQCKVVAGLDREVYRPRSVFEAVVRPGAGPPGPKDNLLCTAELFETAKANLSRYFCFVGLTEHFSESLVLLRHILGWNLSSYSNYRKSPNRPKRETLDPAIMSIVEEYNKFDMMLYQFGRSLFDKAVADSGLKMEQETAALKLKIPSNPWATARHLQSVVFRAAASRLVSLF